MAENQVICIARQFGSGGREIGFVLAKALGVQFYDKELLAAAAKKSGILQELFEKNDEKPTSGLSFVPGFESPPEAVAMADYAAYLPNDRMQKVVAEVIREAADAGPCVIIGRCADYVLRGRRSVFSVFIHAPVELRIQRIARLHNLDEDRARALIRKTDRSRANYYAYYTDRNWDAADNYNLAVNAGRLGIQGTVQLLQQAAGIF